MMNGLKILSIAIPALFLFSGCAWVKPTPEGKGVRVATNPAEVRDCKKIGETSVFLRDKVAFIQRNPDKVESELTTLGRNSAADMGGDTILPESAVENGERTFSVYRCTGN